MRDIYIKDPDGEPEYDGEEDNEEYEESMEELRFLFDSYNWQTCPYEVQPRPRPATDILDKW